MLDSIVIYDLFHWLHSCLVLCLELSEIKWKYWNCTKCKGLPILCKISACSTKVVCGFYFLVINHLKKNYQPYSVSKRWAALRHHLYHQSYHTQCEDVQGSGLCPSNLLHGVTWFMYICVPGYIDWCNTAANPILPFLPFSSFIHVARGTAATSHHALLL